MNISRYANIDKSFFTSPSGIQLIISASPNVEITSPGRRARGFVNPWANVSNFAEETVPGMDDNEFRRHFRIGKSVFNILIQEFEPFLVRHIGGREPLSVYKQLLIFHQYTRKHEGNS